jgi:tetratricopeptide (TPR) repeat protein
MQWRDGEVLGAIGKAYAAMGDNDHAIESYLQALTDEGSRARIVLIKDLANLMERDARSKPADVRGKSLDQAIAMLQTLAQIVDTAEVNAVIGAFYKRRGASVANRNEPVRDYEEAFERYAHSFERRQAMGDLEMYYPGVNAAALAYVLQQSNSGEGREAAAIKWKQVLRDSVAAATERRKRTSDFWARVTAADALVIESLWDETLAKREQHVVAAYKDVIDGAGQAFEFDSMVGQLTFLASACPAHKETLETIVQVLKTMMPDASRG